MTTREKVWSAIGETLRGLMPYYQEDAARHVRAAGSPDHWFSLSAIRAVDPKPFTPLQVAEHFPYNAVEERLKVFGNLASEGFLESCGDECYRLAPRGRELIEGFFQTAHRGLSAAEPLSADKMAQLSDLLGRLVQAVVEAPDPRAKPALLASRWTDPGEDGSQAARVDQYLTDLVRFRDDAHVAAWKAYGLTGQAWEALTYVWREQARTAADLAGRLAYRGFGEEAYADVLRELVGRGWITRDANQVQITSEGKRIREEAEAETSRIHFESWSVLNDAELENLLDLLRHANENLEKIGQEDLWNLATEVSSAIFQVTRTAVNPVIEKAFENPRAFFPLLLVTGNAPKPLTVADFKRRLPYTSPERASQLLADAVASGLIAESEKGAFAVAEQGKIALERVNTVFYNCLGELEVLTKEDVAELAGYLGKVVESSLNVPDPVSGWSIANSVRGHPGGYAPLAKIDQYLDDLNAFRDDAHIAAWRTYGVTGRTWETLTLVWRRQAESAAELIEKLPNRGYSTDDYARSLAELADRGWLQRRNGRFSLTKEGRSVRQEAEEVTNRYFFGPWSCLADRERRRLRYLMIQLKLDLEQLAKEGQTQASS